MDADGHALSAPALGQLLPKSSVADTGQAVTLHESRAHWERYRSVAIPLPSPLAVGKLSGGRVDERVGSELHPNLVRLAVTGLPFLDSALRCKASQEAIRRIWLKILVLAKQRGGPRGGLLGEWW